MAPNWANMLAGNYKYMRDLREQTSPCARRPGEERFAHVMRNRPVSSYTAGAQIDSQEFQKKTNAQSTCYRRSPGRPLF